MEEENKPVVEEKKPEQKKGVSVGLLIVLLIVAAVGGLLLGKVVFNTTNPEETKTEEKEEEEEEQKEEEKTDSINVTVEIPDRMLQFIYMEYLGKRENINLVEELYSRNDLIGMLVMHSEEASITTDKDIQEAYYVDYSVYKAKYEEIFGNNYEPSPENSTSCDNHSSVKGQNKVCWINTLGSVSGMQEHTFTTEDGYFDGDEYVIDGKIEAPDGSTKSFSLRYTVENNKGYLKSIIIK